MAEVKRQHSWDELPVALFPILLIGFGIFMLVFGR